MNGQPQLLDVEIRRRVALPYLRWLPRGYDPADTVRWPLIMFLHGRGERGSDLVALRHAGLPPRLDGGLELPAIVVAPQCPASSDWTMQDAALFALLDHVAATHPVDLDRVYLTGLSMGARETYRLAVQQPERFAALAAICGRRPDGLRFADDVQPLCALPLWIFHGARDTVVPIAESEELVADLHACGANVRYTVYPDADHDSWTQAYAEPDLFPWLLGHRRRDAAIEAGV